MDKIVECVMNISEGRDLFFLERMSRIIESCPGAYLLSCSSDRDHNRSVFSFAGSPEGVLAGSWEACREAVSSLDIRVHKGVHPRIGVVDVVPFVPLLNSGLAECGRLAHELGKRMGTELLVPVFMYGEAALKPENANLADIRKGGLPGLQARISDHPPDYGPSAVHSSAGAVAIGSRDVLIAYNIDLASEDLSAAREIARLVRERDGGLPAVRALGLYLESKKCVQVSMNLTNYRNTSLVRVFEKVLQLAERRGIAVAGSEIIGHLPRAALEENAAAYLKIRDFDPSEVFIEDCLEKRIHEKKTRR